MIDIILIALGITLAAHCVAIVLACLRVSAKNDITAQRVEQAETKDNKNIMQ